MTACFTIMRLSGGLPQPMEGYRKKNKLWREFHYVPAIPLNSHAHIKSSIKTLDKKCYLESIMDHGDLTVSMFLG